MEVKLIKAKKIKLVEPTVFYDMSEKEQKSYVSYVKSIIASDPLFKRMDNIVRRNLKRYKNDFYVHDVYSISQDNGDFVWLIRDCGTELIRCNNESFSREGEWTGKLWFNAVLKTSKVNHYYYYDSKKNKLTKITKDKAIQIVDKFNEINLNKN